MTLSMERTTPYSTSDPIIAAPIIAQTGPAGRARDS
jgi:hypothetical protein